MLFVENMTWSKIDLILSFCTLSHCYLPCYMRALFLCQQPLHWTGKVVTMTPLVVTGDVEGKLQAFDVSSDDQGNHPDDLSVSVYIYRSCWSLIPFLLEQLGLALDMRQGGAANGRKTNQCPSVRILSMLTLTFPSFLAGGEEVPVPVQSSRGRVTGLPVGSVPGRHLGLY